MQANVAQQSRDRPPLRRNENRVWTVSIFSSTTPASYEFEPLAEITEEHFHRQFNLNVLGLLLTSKKAADTFGPEGGSIINISSVVSVEPAAWRLRLLRRRKRRRCTSPSSLAKELGARKIRVNSLNPGMMETEGTHAAGFIGSDFDRNGRLRKLRSVASANPMTIGPVAVFLASEDSALGHRPGAARLRRPEVSRRGLNQRS